MYKLLITQPDFIYLWRFDLYQRPLFSSSSSCHGGDVTWQEIGHMRGLACTHSKGGTAFYEPGRGHLHTEPHIRPISCHITSLSWQELEEELRGVSHFLFENLVAANLGMRLHFRSYEQLREIASKELFSYDWLTLPTKPSLGHSP